MFLLARFSSDALITIAPPYYSRDRPCIQHSSRCLREGGKVLRKQLGRCVWRLGGEEKEEFIHAYSRIAKVGESRALPLLSLSSVSSPLPEQVLLHPTISLIWTQQPSQSIVISHGTLCPFSVPAYRNSNTFCSAGGYEGGSRAQGGVDYGPHRADTTPLLSHKQWRGECGVEAPLAAGCVLTQRHCL